MVISEHNRLGYLQTMAFLDSLLPLYKTLKSGGLSPKDAWDRVHIYAREFLTNFQETRVVAADLSTQGAMVWGSFKATDLGEEYRSQKFIEHPKVCSILALTSIEREGLSVSEALIALKKESESLSKLWERVKTAEGKIKKVEGKVA